MSRARQLQLRDYLNTVKDARNAELLPPHPGGDPAKRTANRRRREDLE